MRLIPLFILFMGTLSLSKGHSFLTSPHPMSTLDGCRIGGTGGFIGNCPGPCPNYNIAADADPSNPTVIFQRGGYHRVVWSRNNHEGGFVRWTMVPLHHKDSKTWHAKMAFHYNCWNVGRFNCNDFDFHRDCNYDRQNEAYGKMLYIPPVFPDGDYVLGWTWYGGGVGFGHFGDYYDCAYVRVSGGEPVQESYVPEFAAGGGSGYEDGCESTVDDLGICWKEPCLPIRKTEKRVPAPFKDGKTPEPILSEWYGEGTSTNPASVGLSRVLLVDARQDRVLEVDLEEIILLHRNDEISLLAETTGDVEYVEWYTNGKANGKDYSTPYTVAGDDHKDDIYPWMHPLFNRRMRVSIKIVGKDGTFSWGNVELRFKEGGSGAAHFPGQPIHDYLDARNVHEDEDGDDHEDPEWIQEPISDADTTGTTEETESTVTEDESAPHTDTQPETIPEQNNGPGSSSGLVSQPAPDTTTTSGSTEAHDSSGSTVSAAPPQPVAVEAPEDSASTGAFGGSSASTGSASVSAGGSSSFSGSFLGIGGAGSSAGVKRGRAAIRSVALSSFINENEVNMKKAYGQFA